MVFVSHDRYFIEKLASRVIELNKSYPRDHLVSDGSYSDYIEYREQVVAQLAHQRQSLANKVRREVEWLRAGVKARTTKAQARINQAHTLIDTLQSTPRGKRNDSIWSFLNAAEDKGAAESRTDLTVDGG